MLSILDQSNKKWPNAHITHLQDKTGIQSKKKRKNNWYLKKNQTTKPPKPNKPTTPKVIQYDPNCSVISARKLSNLFSAPLTSVRTLCENKLANRNHTEGNYFTLFSLKICSYYGKLNYHNLNQLSLLLNFNYIYIIGFLHSIFNFVSKLFFKKQ